jgi:VanZ family protein
MRLWAPVALTMALIYLLSAQPLLPAPPGGLSDKQAHALAYGVLAVLWYRALAGGRWAGVTLGRAAVAAGAATAYSVTDEWHQMFVAGRMPELADLGADAAGAVLGTAAVFAWGILYARRRRDQAIAQDDRS